MQAIIDECEAGNINGRVVGVVSNVPNVLSLERAKKHNIPSLVIDHKNFESRASFDEVLAKSISEFSADLIVLAGFMRILSAHFVKQFTGRMLNIHPSLLPKYPGLHTHNKVIENKDSQHGASVHFVTAELDGGPVVLQSIIKVSENDTVISLQEKLNKTEWLIYPLAVKWFCQGALRIEQDKVLFIDNLDMSLLRDEASVDCKIKINDQGIQNDEETK